MESFAVNIAERLLTLLASHARNEIKLAWGVKEELGKLKETLGTITTVLQDAEEKQTKDRGIILWLGKLKDVCYDADEVLDEYWYQNLRIQVLTTNGGIKGKVRSLFSTGYSPFFRIRMGHRIKDIRKRLDEIAVEKYKYSLVKRERPGDSHRVHMNRETHSYIQASNVIGRDDDKKIITNHLLKDIDQHEECVSVVSIVGIGGLGKTTLAQLVYNDKRVVDEFTVKMWICVSNEFDNKKLIRDIVLSASGEKCDLDDTLERMQKKLQNSLKDKKFLLVLDDVWDTEPVGVTARKWKDLKTLLDVGGHGSKIIVTTRSESIASLMGSIHMHTLKGLAHGDCMSLFKKMAFGRSEEVQQNQQIQQLMEIGEDIVKKCAGVPLAIASVGSLLRLKRELHDWLHVRDSDIWELKQGDDGILPALKLSYDALPPHLKPCFAYCSLFQKDHVFDSWELVPMWMAEGFISPIGNQGIEEMGMGYIRELCSRCFFEKIDELGLHAIFDARAFFKMHDLVHDLAISVSQVDCSSMNSRPSLASERVRHVSLLPKDLSDGGGQIAGSILQLSKVRTVLILKSNVSDHVVLEDQHFFKACISMFKYLRVLDMSYSILKVLPSSVGNLIHLRYLDLTGNGMIEKLPDSICKLHNLQTLNLLGCSKLKELPKDIGNLISLVHLEITTQQMCLPKGIKGLTSLQTLCFYNCRNLTSFGEVMQSLTKLQLLLIVHCRNIDLMMDSRERIPSLRHFTIMGHSNLEALPRWLHDSANSLQFLSITECENLSVLPEWLQDFKLLENVEIDDCPKLLAMPEGMQHLIALRKLTITACPVLIERCKKEEGEDWPKIAHVAKVILDGVVIGVVENIEDAESSI